MTDSALLTVDNLQAWYGESHILHGVSFDVRVGEVVVEGTRAEVVAHPRTREIYLGE